jgi:c-di-GMP-binding flagellar brake protein YcgR
MRDKQPSINKRNFYRLDDRVQIRVKKLPSPSEQENAAEAGQDNLNEKSHYCQHFTIDISATGAKFASSEPYPEGQHLEIRFLFREFVTPVHVNAVVLRSHRAETARCWQVAVKFFNIDTRDAALIERYIFERQRQMIAEKRVGFL